MKHLILPLACALFIGAVLAAPLEVKKGSTITVEEYDPKMNIFVVSIKGEAVGPNYVQPESLRKAIAFEGSANSFMKQKDQMIKSVYQIKSALPLVSEEEILKRAKGVVKKENKK